MYALLLAALAVLAPSFHQGGNWRDILVGNAPLLLSATGMTLVVLTRHIDISIGSQFAICGVVAGLLAKAGLPMAAVAFGTVGAGLAMGGVNALLVAFLGLPSIVATLATMVALREGLRWATQGAWVENLPAGFQWFGAGQAAGRWLIVAVALAVFTAMAWALTHLRAGRAVYATGSDAEAARLLGVPARATTALVFVVLGGLNALAALLSAVQFIDVQAGAGLGLELKVIAAVVVGGTAITGGRGTALGTLLGVALLGTLGPALTFLGSHAYWERALQGAIILAAVATDALSGRGGSSRPVDVSPESARAA
ncbi:MAG TPA: ABC transporter permease [Vicinamibacteria bacterium]|nr:ABC transporter permease [Vicinamibacteria bacterium]